MSLPNEPRAVVTGAASGLGRAFCRRLAARRARIIACDVDEAGLAETLAELRGADAHAMRCDVTRADDVAAVAAEADRRFGATDLLINNAGVAVAGRVGEVSLDDWQWIVGVNLWGVVHGCHEFVPRMRRQKSGYILNVASAAGLLSPPRMAPYNATKAAVIALSETLRAELFNDGIGVSVLCPTFFPTSIGKNARVADDAMRALVEKAMARSKHTSDEVAELALAQTEAGQLYVVPMRDGRWLWRMKRLAPERFPVITAKKFERIPG